VNIADLGPGWWVFLSLPDGRFAVADAENPDHAAAVAAIRRRDFAAVATWLDAVEPLPDGHLFAWGEAA
jgi:hypothetical protein